jgi:hypothetical protein
MELIKERTLAYAGTPFLDWRRSLEEEGLQFNFNLFKVQTIIIQFSLTQSSGLISSAISTHQAMPHPPHPLASLAQIHTSRSRKDGIPFELEDDLRVVGCMLIQEVGILLEL